MNSMSMLEKHLMNLAVVVRHYNKLNRPLRRQLHQWSICLPAPDSLVEEIPATFLDHYVDCANLATWLSETYDGPQLTLVPAGGLH